MPETTSGDKDGAEAARAARIESARADFVSSLGRRTGELKTILNGLDQDPGSPRLRADLRRRVHAISAGARLLRFSGMATALAEAERTLERAASVGGLTRSELRDISQILENLPSFAQNEPTHEQRPTERPPATAPIGETAVVPPTILVIGPSGLADAITNAIESAAENELDCERSDTTAGGLELARALAPDVVVIDADLPGVKELLEKLGKDALTEPTPLIVVGTWATPEEGARWVAAGATLALAKPVSPHDLRKACMDLTGGTAEPLHHGPLGQTTVEQLTSLIIGEINRGLPEALVQGKATPIQLGDGSDILAAVWGAVARVRDLVMIKSGGAVRFSNQGPEGALPIAPWWGDSMTPAPRGGEGVREPQPRLEGRRVVVADDDPAVTWFIGGLLRAAGALVREAHDGDRALELCFRLSPDLVISDVLMPGLDGFALCRALKRDIALRDVPVILLSWKEDLLQRLRDLGADADGYLRKEASAAAILQRVHEVLRTRHRIEARLKGEGEVRGRLDGVTPATLLQTIERVRPDARLCIRDASFLYEVEMRNGAPRSATRTTSDGSFQRGKEVFAALLGVRTGRYVVARAQGSARGTLDGTLAAQMESPLAHARAALRLLGGTRLLEVQRVNIALDRVLAYLGATPEPARSLLQRLAKGASPRELILAGEVAPAQLEEVLCDLAARGAVVGVQAAGGLDLLGPALEQEIASIRRGEAPSHPPGWQAARKIADPDTPPTGPAAPAMPPRPADSATGAKPATAAQVDTVPAVAAVSKIRPARELAIRAGSPTEDAPLPVDRPPVDSSPQIEAEELSRAWPEAGGDERTPSSLEAALIREISDGTPISAVKAQAGASIVDASELKARAPGAAPRPVDSPGPIPSLPPDAIVPAYASEDKIRSPEGVANAVVIPASLSDERIQVSELATTGQALMPLAPAENRPPDTAVAHEADGAPLPASGAPAPPVQRGGLVIGGMVTLAAIGGIILLFRNERALEDSPSGASIASSTSKSPTRSTTVDLMPPGMAASAWAASSGAEVAPAPSDRGPGAPSPSASATPMSGEDLPLPTGAVVAPGQGLLDIETGAREAIFVDSVELGRGPFLRLTLTPGVHEVRLRAHGEERIRFVLIRSARRTRLPLSSAWAR